MDKYNLYKIIVFSIPTILNSIIEKYIQIQFKLCNRCLPQVLISTVHAYAIQPGINKIYIIQTCHAAWYHDGADYSAATNLP